MYIDRDMYYDDDAQDLHIHFNKGETVLLDGQKQKNFLDGERIMMVQVLQMEI